MAGRGEDLTREEPYVSLRMTATRAAGTASAQSAWDAILGAEIARAYKPRRVQSPVCGGLGLEPPGDEGGAQIDLLARPVRAADSLCPPATEY